MQLNSKRLTLTVAGAALLFGLGGAEVRRFERIAAEDIRSKLDGESRLVSVQARLNGLLGGPLGDLSEVTIRASRFSTDALPLFTEPDRSKRGVVRKLRIVLDDFVLAGLRVEHLEAEIPDCRFDYGLAVRRRQIRLSRSGLGTGRVRVLEKDLEAYILRRFKEIKRVSVRLDKERVFVEGYGQFLIVQSEFFVIAKLAPTGGDKLVLSEARVIFPSGPTGEDAKQAILAALNPVVDLNRDLHLHGAIHLRGLRIAGGALEAWGETRIPDRP
jgi:hypothetical protein